MAYVIDPVVKSYLDFLYAQRKARWDEIETVRDYEQGDVTAQMTDDQKILLVGADSNGNPNSNPEFNINICRPICKAPAARLKVKGVRVTVPDNEQLGTEISKEVWRWWELSGLTGNGQKAVHYSAIRDGNSYPIVDYTTFPRVTNNMAYDGSSGTEMAYEDGHSDTPLYAAKRWTMQRPTVNNLAVNKTRRMNLYFDNRIEYYITEGMSAGSSEAGWRRLREGDRDYDPEHMTEAILTDPYGRNYTAVVTWLTDDGTPDGVPIGNPVKHLRPDALGEPYGRSRIRDIVPGLQDAVNAAGIDVQAASRLNGFKEVVVTGFYPTEDASGKSNALLHMPGAYQYIEEPDAAISQTSETDLNQLIAVLDKWIVVCATLTNTPLSMFNLTAHTPAEGTQKQLESSLVADVEDMQTGFGSTWQAVVRQQMKFDTLYNPASVIPIEMYPLIDDFDINIEWEPAETRNDVEQRQIAVMDKNDLGVPEEFVWERFWTSEEIERMKAMKNLLQNNVLGSMAQMVADIEAQNAARIAAGETVLNAQEQDTDANDSTDRNPALAGASAGANGNRVASA